MAAMKQTLTTKDTKVTLTTKDTNNTKTRASCWGQAAWPGRRVNPPMSNE